MPGLPCPGLGAATHGTWLRSERMTTRPERGLFELYADPERADFELWGRRCVATDRRGFLKGAGLAAMAGFLRASIPMARYMPAGLIPVPLAGSAQPFALPGKSALVILNDRPIGAECPAHLLDDAITPVERLFVRNNGLTPSVAQSEAPDWTVEVTGEACLSPRTFSLRDLRTAFQSRTYQLQLECAGNGRGSYLPPAAGMQWTTGAVGCPRWTGVRVRDVLERCGIAGNAVYVAYEGADRHLSGSGALPISRGVPLLKALEDDSLLAWAINGEPLAALHGFPLRLVFGGWPGSASGKWVRRILVRDRVHDGERMLGQSYRVPCEPVAPGTAVPDERMCIIHSMPVKSLVTFPQSGIDHPMGEPLHLRGRTCLNASRIPRDPCNRGEPLYVRGHAWAGDVEVAEVHTSIDFGTTWQQAHLQPPANRLAWQHWSTRVSFPAHGYYEIWARAVDAHGRSQPMVVPAWNPRGYLNNACHRIAVRVTGR